MSPVKQEHEGILLIKRRASEVIAAAAVHKMDGWAKTIASELDDSASPMFAIEDAKKGIIGQAGLKIWPKGSSRAAATIALFDPKERGLGIGTKIMRDLLAYAFAELGLSKVVVRADFANIAAVRCYQKAGFVQTRTDDKEGAVLMTVLREAWVESERSLSMARGCGRWRRRRD